MDERKSIKPDILNLFDKVKLQAEQYYDAFNFLTRRIEQSKLLDKHIENKLSDLIESNNGFKQEIENSIYDKFAEINEKISKINEIWDNLETLIKLQNELYEQNHIFQEQSNKISQDFQSFIESINDEYDKLSNELKSKTQSEIESFLSKAEVKLLLQYKKNEGQIRAMQDFINDSLSFLKFQIENIQSEMKVLKNKTDANQATEFVMRNQLLKKVNEIEFKLTDTIDKYSIKFKDLANLDKELKNRIHPDEDELIYKYQVLSDKYNKLEKKLLRMKVFLFILVICAIIVFILAFHTT